MKTAEEIKAEVFTIFKFSRLERLCKAEKDNRLVILPCKVGDIIYEIDNGKIYRATVVGHSIGSNGRVFVHYVPSYTNEEFSLPLGYALFRTRKEAQKALERQFRVEF